MGEEEVSTEFLGNPLVLGEFSAVVSRQRMYAGRKRRQQGNHGVRDSPCGLERDVGVLTEAVMGQTAGMCRIAEAIDNLAEAVRERGYGS